MKHAARLGCPIAIAVALALGQRISAGQDCNQNGVPDSLDVQGRVQFDLPRTYVTGTVAFFESPGDFNGDGFVDFVTCEVSTNRVGLLLNRGDGTFAPRVMYATGLRPNGTAVGDINGDGRDDVVVVLRDAHQVQAFLGNPNGTLTALPAIAVGNLPLHVGLARMDADADLDLVVVHSGSITAGRVLANNGAGGFFPLSTFNATASAAQLLLVDLTNDGRAEILITMTTQPDNQFDVLMNNGNGVMLSSTFHPTSGGVSGLAASDVDADGDTDVVVARANASSVQIWWNNNFVGLGPGPVVTTPASPQRVAFADIVADATPELIVRAGASAAIFVRSGPPQFYQLHRTVPLQRFAGALAAEDLDNDSDVDLAAGSGLGVLMTVMNDGVGEFTPAVVPFALTLPDSTGTAGPLEMADFSGDGVNDLAVVRELGVGPSALRIYHRQGSTYTLVDVEPAGDAVYAMRAADIDGDDDLDLLVPHGTVPQVGVYRNDGAGEFGAVEAYPVPGELLGIDVGDLDGDQDADFVVASGGAFQSAAGGGCNCYTGGAVYVFHNGGDGTFTLAQTLDAGLGPFGVALAQFDGDDRADLAVASSTSNQVQVFGNTGAGQFHSAPLATLATGTRPAGVHAADFDDDGHVDLIGTRVDTSAFFDDAAPLWYGRGDGTFEPPAFVPGVTASLGARTHDLDTDGDLDIICPNVVTDDVVMIENRGGRQFEARSYWANGAAFGVALADWDGDSRTDVVASNAVLNDRALPLLNRSAPAASADANGNQVPDECERFPGDMNCNGVLNAGDIGGFVLALTDRPAYLAANPTCLAMNADVNSDGMISVGDIAPFVALLTGR